MNIPQNLVYIIYDGVANPVFEGQVIYPLSKKIISNQNLTIHLISFEATSPSTQWLHNFKNIHQKNITLHIFTRTRFWGLWSLSPLIKKLKMILKTLDRYTIIARGPLAGYIAQQSITQSCKHTTIQVRGLLAEEYRFAHRTATFPFSLLHSLRKYQYFLLEKKVFTHAYHLEAVTQALKKYLCTTYKISPHRITIAHNDIPKIIQPEQKKLFRTQIRIQLNIQKNIYVYVYNGSAKPWQCPQQTVDFFCTQYTKNLNSYLLILTRDVDDFKKILRHSEIPSHAYSIHSVAHSNIIPYLCAADEGLLLREPDIINWVSRPTKALEYRAAGLLIRHNNTVHFLISHTNNTQKKPPIKSGLIHYN